MAERSEWDKQRDREMEMDRERGEHRLDYGARQSRGPDASRWENEGGRLETEHENRGNLPRYEGRRPEYQDDYRRERGEWQGGSRNADYGQRGDWGRQGSWGTYGNRPGYDRRDEHSQESYRSGYANPGGGHNYYGGERRGELESSQYGGMYVGEYGGRSTGRSEGQHNQLGGMSSGYSRGQYGGGMPSGGYGGGMGSYAGGLGMEQGQHAGRGPKNWQRSDERIKEDVNERLTEHSHIDATEVDVQVKNGEVTLTGTVEDRRIKRMVEDLVEGVSGVKDVHNQLRASSGAQPASEKAKGAGSQSGETATTGSQSRK